MNGWLSSKYRKVHQRAMNKLVRKVNKSIENDDLWRGRFYVKQVDSAWVPYEDHSGSQLYVKLRFVDKKTGKIQDVHWGNVNSWRFRWGGKLFRAMNDFIVLYCEVWKNEKPYEDKTDYRLAN